MKMRDILLFSQYSVIFAKSKTHDFDGSHEKLYGNDIVFSLKFPLAFFCRLLYHNREHNWINCLRGGVKFPTGGIVREQEPVRFRYRQYSLDERRRVRHFRDALF